MPHAMVLPLERANDAPLPPGAAELTHAAFFDLLRRADASLAERLHADAERKPFTLGPLRDARKGGGAALRLTFLDDRLFPAFAGALLSGGLEAGLRVGEARFVITGLLTTPGAHPLAGCARYPDLLRAAQEAETVPETLLLRFATPTVFRSQKRDVLWPEPRLVWQSWARTWNAHADGPQQLDEARLVEQAETKVTVERHQLETRRVVLREGALIGFVGVCVYGLRELAEADRRVLTLLADFAFYAGTGRKTTMGLGQTRRLPTVRPRSEQAQKGEEP